MEIGPGDFVLCVDDRPAAWTGQRLLIAGRVYRVRSVEADTEAPDGSVGPGATVDGIKLPRSDNGRETCWRLSRFRLIYRPKSGLLDSLLAPEEVGVC
jgi:hypothetical protein